MKHGMDLYGKVMSDLGGNHWTSMNAYKYIQAVVDILADPELAEEKLTQLTPYLTSTCCECDEEIIAGESTVVITADGQFAHLVIEGYVIIGCEGYWLIDPNLLGLDDPNWDDWTKPVVDECPECQGGMRLGKHGVDHDA